MNLLLYCKALGKHWWALMSCAVFTGIGVYAAWAAKTSSWLIWASGAAAMILLIVASFLAWNEEHEAKVLALAQRLLPNITMTLHQISLAKPADEGLVLTVLSVRNTGAPSIVDTYKMTMNGHPEARIERPIVTDVLIWQYPNFTYRYSPSDQIKEKTAEKPIETGGKKVGFMLWSVRDVDLWPFLAAKTRLEFTITAKDLNGALITAINKARDISDGAHYPGLSGPNAFS